MDCYRCQIQQQAALATLKVLAWNSVHDRKLSPTEFLFQLTAYAVSAQAGIIKFEQILKTF